MTEDSKEIHAQIQEQINQLIIQIQQALQDQQQWTINKLTTETDASHTVIRQKLEDELGKIQQILDASSTIVHTLLDEARQERGLTESQQKPASTTMLSLPSAASVSALTNQGTFTRHRSLTPPSTSAPTTKEAQLRAAIALLKLTFQYQPTTLGWFTAIAITDGDRKINVPKGVAELIAIKNNPRYQDWETHPAIMSELCEALGTKASELLHSHLISRNVQSLYLFISGLKTTPAKTASPLPS